MRARVLSFQMSLFFCCLLATNFTVASSSSQSVNTPDIATIIAFLQPDSPVLTVKGLPALTWKEFAPLQKAMAISAPQAPRITPKQLRTKIFMFMRHCAQRGLFLLEARSMRISLSPAERIQLESEMLANLKAQGKTVKREELPNLFSKESTLLRVSYDDMLRLLQFEKLKISPSTVPSELVSRNIALTKASQQLLVKENARRLQQCKDILKDKRSQDDKGFAQLCKDFSDGVEAKWGGELKYDFTREQLAAICYMDTFKYKVGETTPVCETNSAFRIVRVLREVPQKNGAAPKLRVAQILMGKLPVEDTSVEAITAKLKHTMAKQNMEALAFELSKKYSVTTPFFPLGLWPIPHTPAKSSTTPSKKANSSLKHP